MTSPISDILKTLAKQFIDKGYDAGIKEANIDYPEFTEYAEIAKANQAILQVIAEAIDEAVSFYDYEDGNEVAQDIGRNIKSKLGITGDTNG